jgi:DegV family protein with EDD domain
MTVRIVTDSTCDLPAATLARYDIRVVPLYINAGQESFLDGVDITREEFYKRLPTFPVHPTTAVPSPQRFRAEYEALAAEGATDILSLHISATLSAVMDEVRVAARETNSVRVTPFDTQQLSLGTGFVVEAAARLAAEGRSLSEMLLALKELVQRVHVFAALDTLEFLRRSGRMNRVVAGLGSLLQLKPIMTMHDGKAGAERVRTHRRAIERVVELLRNVGPLERLAIVHTHAPDRVTELREHAAPWLPAGEIETANITPVIGAHIGPGAVGFAVVAQG